MVLRVLLLRLLGHYALSFFTNSIGLLFVIIIIGCRLCLSLMPPVYCR